MQPSRSLPQELLANIVSSMVLQPGQSPTHLQAQMWMDTRYMEIGVNKHLAPYIMMVLAYIMPIIFLES